MIRNLLQYLVSHIRVK